MATATYNLTVQSNILILILEFLFLDQQFQRFKQVYPKFRVAECNGDTFLLDTPAPPFDHSEL